MVINAVCQNCKRVYPVDEQYAGQTFSCETCGQPFTVPIPGVVQPVTRVPVSPNYATPHDPTEITRDRKMAARICIALSIFGYFWIRLFRLRGPDFAGCSQPGRRVDLHSAVGGGHHARWRCDDLSGLRPKNKKGQPNCPHRGTRTWCHKRVGIARALDQQHNPTCHSWSSGCGRAWEASAHGILRRHVDSPPLPGGYLTIDLSPYPGSTRAKKPMTLTKPGPRRLSQLI